MNTLQVQDSTALEKKAEQAVKKGIPLVLRKGYKMKLAENMNSKLRDVVPESDRFFTKEQYIHEVQQTLLLKLENLIERETKGPAELCIQDVDGSMTLNEIKDRAILIINRRLETKE